ncbi:iron dependent repressor [Methanospirillum hungatei JF-1]|uniref:Iron dependent repressor n=1 Tax=Methanospirillum hungatei JF-1 (strain ATCC 27890 / DSM 864 / NBRC 100397 / JF-1) TaxID=323259 RepID=Q2FNY0_METHJ|nr:metal-dependent transcriptional regulator [Methanospirillum hungatei]ABD41064.1 iron dependent repressor [Methanospirillum hungatei JF-1]
MMEKRTSPRNEDLLEEIYKISLEKGYAKSRDIAGALIISPATVTERFKKLEEAGYVNYERYGGVTLTPEGIRIAERTIQSHYAIRRLLELAGVETTIANRDACIMEHGLSPDSYKKLVPFIKFIEERCKGMEMKKQLS